MILVVIAYVSSLDAQPVPVPIVESEVATQNDLKDNLPKRDFNTRWGGAGMPYSMFKMNHQAKTQKLKKQISRKEKVEAQTSYQKSTMTTQPRRTTPNRKQQYAMQQLFFSYGWGPMG